MTNATEPRRLHRPERRRPAGRQDRHRRPGLPQRPDRATGLDHREHRTFRDEGELRPAAGSSFNGDDLVLPFDKTVVKDSPDIADASHLDADEQQSLYALLPAVPRHRRRPGPAATTGRTATTDSATTGTSAGEGYDTSGPNTDEAMTRSEEQLRVGTEQVEAGRARLRKYVVTEQQTVQVPVSREEVRVEREPITDANRGDALSGADDHRRRTRSRAARRTPRRHHRSRPGGTGPARHRNRHRPGNRHR